MTGLVLSSKCLWSEQVLWTQETSLDISQQHQTSTYQVHLPTATLSMYGMIYLTSKGCVQGCWCDVNTDPTAAHHIPPPRLGPYHQVSGTPRLRRWQRRLRLHACELGGRATVFRRSGEGWDDSGRIMGNLQGMFWRCWFLQIWVPLFFLYLFESVARICPYESYDPPLWTPVAWFDVLLGKGCDLRAWLFLIFPPFVLNNCSSKGRVPLQGGVLSREYLDSRCSGNQCVSQCVPLLDYAVLSGCAGSEVFSLTCRLVCCICILQQSHVEICQKPKEHKQ